MQCLLWTEKQLYTTCRQHSDRLLRLLSSV